MSARKDTWKITKTMQQYCHQIMLIMIDSRKDIKFSDPIQADTLFSSSVLFFLT